MKIQLLLTGNELMAGDIVDSNSAMIAQQFKTLGLEIFRKVTVADDLELLISEIQHISKNADVLIINGGLGPTTDDLTAQALAKAADLEIAQHPDALAHLEHWCKKRNYELNGPNLKQAMLPAGCKVVANAVGSAVGFNLHLNGCDIYCTPGVPRELKQMLTEEIISDVASKYPSLAHAETTRLQVFGYGESRLQEMLDTNFPDFPQTLDIGYRASMPLLELKLTSKSASDLTLKTEWLNKIKVLLTDHVVHEITDKPVSLAGKVNELLASQNKTITTAESCTGGLIASQITQNAGASSVFQAGFVTYSNEVKEKQLGVKSETLAQFGAVSEQTVLEMAQGAIKQANSDYAIAVSGIAGPGGGSDDKPVGTVCIAWGTSQVIETTTLFLPGARSYFQQYVAAISLDLIRRLLIKSNEVPRYLIERILKK